MELDPIEGGPTGVDAGVSQFELVVPNVSVSWPNVGDSSPMNNNPTSMIFIFIGG